MDIKVCPREMGTFVGLCPVYFVTARCFAGTKELVYALNDYMLNFKCI